MAEDTSATSQTVSEGLNSSRSKTVSPDTDTNLGSCPDDEEKDSPLPIPKNKDNKDSKDSKDNKYNTITSKIDRWNKLVGKQELVVSTMPKKLIKQQSLMVQPTQNVDDSSNNYCKTVRNPIYAVELNTQKKSSPKKIQNFANSPELQRLKYQTASLTISSNTTKTKPPGSPKRSYLTKTPKVHSFEPYKEQILQSEDEEIVPVTNSTPIEDFVKLDPRRRSVSILPLPSCVSVMRVEYPISPRTIQFFPNAQLPVNALWDILIKYCDIPAIGALALTNRHVSKLTSHASFFKSIVCYAQKGDPEAQAKLGYMHEKGWGVLQANDKEAQYWYKKAKQSVDANFLLGLMMVQPVLNNPESEINNELEEGYTHIVYAAVRGQPWAQYYMGLFYERSVLIECWKNDPVYQRCMKDSVNLQARLILAKYWYCIAASSKLSKKSAGRIGLLYMNSTKQEQHLPANLAKAFCWMSLSIGINSAEPDVLNQYGELYEIGMKVTFDLWSTPKASSKLIPETLQSLQMSPEQAYSTSKIQRIRSILTQTFSPNMDKLQSEISELESYVFLSEFTKSDYGNNRKFHIIVVLNQKVVGSTLGKQKVNHTIHLKVDSDQKIASSYYLAAANKECTPAQVNLARLSLVVDKNIQCALAWASVSAGKGDAHGLNMVGVIAEVRGYLQQYSNEGSNRSTTASIKPLPMKVPKENWLQRSVSTSVLLKQPNVGNPWQRTVIEDKLYQQSDMFLPIVNYTVPHEFSLLKISDEKRSARKSLRIQLTLENSQNSQALPTPKKFLSNPKLFAKSSDTGNPATFTSVVRRLSEKMMATRNVLSEIPTDSIEEESKKWYAASVNEGKSATDHEAFSAEGAYNYGRMLMITAAKEGDFIADQMIRVCTRSIERHVNNGFNTVIEVGFGMSLTIPREGILESRNELTLDNQFVLTFSRAMQDSTECDALNSTFSLVNAAKMIFGIQALTDIMNFENANTATCNLSDTLTAMDYFAMAAKRGLASAMLILARWNLWRALLSVSYSTTMASIEYDFNRIGVLDSIRYYKQAAEKGESVANLELAKLYLSGFCLASPDCVISIFQKSQEHCIDDNSANCLKEAKECLWKSANRGLTESVLLYGELLLEEEEMKSQKIIARKRVSTGKKMAMKAKALFSGSRKQMSMINLKTLVNSQEYPSEDEVNDELFEERAKIMAWIRSAAAEGSLRAQKLLTSLKKATTTNNPGYWQEEAVIDDYAREISISTDNASENGEELIEGDAPEHSEIKGEKRQRTDSDEKKSKKPSRLTGMLTKARVLIRRRSTNTLSQKR